LGSGNPLSASPNLYVGLGVDNYYVIVMQ